MTGTCIIIQYTVQSDEGIKAYSDITSPGDRSIHARSNLLHLVSLPRLLSVLHSCLYIVFLSLVDLNEPKALLVGISTTSPTDAVPRQRKDGVELLERSSLGLGEEEPDEDDAEDPLGEEEVVCPGSASPESASSALAKEECLVLVGNRSSCLTLEFRQLEGSHSAKSPGNPAGMGRNSRMLGRALVAP